MKLILIGLIILIQILGFFYFFFNNSSGIKSLAGGVFKETVIGGGANIVNASNIANVATVATVATVANIAKKSSFLANITKCHNIISDII